jgi:hypothetical protein
MTSTFQSIEAGWEKWAKQVISHAVQYWDAPRMISVTGADGSFDSISLIGTQLAAGKDIRMEAGSALPISKAAKQAFLMDCMKMGFIDPQKGLSLMDMGGMDELYDELKIDERAAQRENLRMARLDIEEIMQHEQNAQMTNEFAAMQEQMQVNQNPPMVPNDQMQPPMDPAAMGGPMGGGDPMAQGGPDPSSDPAAMGMDPSMMQPEPPTITGGPPGPAGTDPNNGAPLMLPMNILPVNTWDNHQLHIDVHNRFRKSQAFDLLPPEVKQQFEYHVAQHAMVLNQAAQSAAMLPPPPDAADNGSGAPVGAQPAPDANQFGPAGTQDGAPPDPSMMMG